MAITGISAISGEQIIAAGAVSAKEAGKASFTTGGNNIQSLYDTVSTNSASWTGGTTGDYISAKGFSQRISNAAGDKFLSFWNEAGGSTATAYPTIYLSGQFGSAYYKDNELKLGRNNHNIAFNIGGQGPKISAGATGTIPSYMYIYNAGNSATISQSGLNLSNSTANENVTIASIQSWNAKGDMHESSFNYDADNKISGYNGSAFATGSELPTGVMVESGLEYNAVNEISGYSGFAFAQYGADKQWLVHDDTLLHVANSAQYALGVNVSAVAQLMGVDETVLWSGTAAPSNFPLTMSEPFSAFEKIEFVWDTRYNGDYGTPTKGTIVYTDNHGSTVPTKYTLVEAYANASQTWWDWWYLENDNNGTALSNLKAIYYPMTGGNSASQTNCRLFKVIGIGRKEV